MAHDILIYTHQKLYAETYKYLLVYLGKHYPRRNKKESDLKNGIRMVLEQSNNRVTKNQIKKWAKSRAYFFRQAIIMDIETSEVIYKSLLECLMAVDNKTKKVAAYLKAHFDLMKNDAEVYSQRLAILLEVYRILADDSNINVNSAEMCRRLGSTDAQHNLEG